MLLLLFGVFLYYTVMALRRGRADAFVEEARKVGWRARTQSLAVPVGLLVGGMAALAVGANLLVDSAVEIAGRLGMTPTVIGLTIVSIGTTTPELTTSVLAARKGEADLAVGNIVGSYIFNILAVLGTATTIAPIEVSTRGHIALLIATGLIVALYVMTHTHGNRVTRWEGVALLVVFAGYMTWLVLAR